MELKPSGDTLGLAAAAPKSKLPSDGIDICDASPDTGIENADAVGDTNVKSAEGMLTAGSETTADGTLDGTFRGRSLEAFLAAVTAEELLRFRLLAAEPLAILRGG